VSQTAVVDAALARVADRLSARFAGTVNRPTIERCLFEAYVELERGATVRSHLLALAEHATADRLAALDHDAAMPTTLPRVLFLCAYNAGRSQIAAAFASRYAHGRVAVDSAGSHPADTLDATVAEVLAESGLDTHGASPKALTQHDLETADVIVTMGCDDACPVLPGKRYLDWDILDPAGADLATVRAIRDDIDRRVHALIQQLTNGDM
jgi:protein-tyrosine-phosphatase